MRKAVIKGSNIVLYRQGEAAKDIYFVVKGEVLMTHKTNDRASATTSSTSSVDGLAKWMALGDKLEDAGTGNDGEWRKKEIDIRLVATGCCCGFESLMLQRRSCSVSCYKTTAVTKSSLTSLFILDTAMAAGIVD